MSKNTYGRGKYKVWLKKSKIGNDLVYFIGGGEKPHIGAITICEEGKRARDVKFMKHFDYIITRPIAEAAFKKHGCKVVCVGGVHIDNASREEIAKVVKNCKQLARFV